MAKLPPDEDAGNEDDDPSTGIARAMEDYIRRATLKSLPTRPKVTDPKDPTFSTIDYANAIVNQMFVDAKGDIPLDVLRDAGDLVLRAVLGAFSGHKLGHDMLRRAAVRAGARGRDDMWTDLESAAEFCLMLGRNAPPADVARIARAALSDIRDENGNLLQFDFDKAVATIRDAKASNHGAARLGSALGKLAGHHAEPEAIRQAKSRRNR